MMTKAAMSIFSCYFPEGDDTGASFMVAQPSEPCWTEDGLQFALIAPAVLVILFYSLGYPVGLWTLYHNNRHIILRDQLLKAAGKGYSIKTNKDIHFRRRYGILYSYFKPTHYWWVLMFIGRKFFVSAFAVGLRNYPTFQLASMLLVMFCCLLIQVRQRPFLDTRERAELLIDLNQKKLVYANSLIAHMNVFARAHHQDMNIESDRMRKLRKRITNFEAVIKSLRLQLLNHDTWWWNLNTLEETLSTGAVVLMLAGITFDTTFVKNSPNVRVIIALVMASLLIIMIVFYIMSFVHEYKNVKKVNKKLARVEWSKLKAWRIHNFQENKVRNSRKVLPAGLEVKREAAAKEAEKTHLANMLGTREARVSIARQASIGGGRQSNSLSRKISLQAPILSSYNDELNSNAATRSQGGTLSRQSTHHVENVDDLLDLFGGDSNDAGGMGFDLDDLFNDENVMNGDAEKGLDFMNVCMEPTHDQNGGSGFNIDSFLESGTTFERKPSMLSKSYSNSRDGARNKRAETRKTKRSKSRKLQESQKQSGGTCLDEFLGDDTIPTEEQKTTTKVGMNKSLSGLFGELESNEHKNDQKVLGLDSDSDSGGEELFGEGDDEKVSEVSIGSPAGKGAAARQKRMADRKARKQNSVDKVGKAKASANARSARAQAKIAKVEKRGKRKKGKSKKREKERQKERQSGTSLADMMNDEEDITEASTKVENIQEEPKKKVSLNQPTETATSSAFDVNEFAVSSDEEEDKIVVPVAVPTKNIEKQTIML